MKALEKLHEEGAHKPRAWRKNTLLYDAAKVDAAIAELQATIEELREREPSEAESECGRYRHLYEAESRIRKAQDATIERLKCCGNCVYWLTDKRLCPASGHYVTTQRLDSCHFTPSRWQSREEAVG